MILAVESSCDETALAVFDPAAGMRGEWVHSQMALHERHGGVVPDLATREHLRNLGPLLARAGETVPFARVTQVAVTHGPGLAPCLALGVAAAKALALALRVPLTGVNHLRGHVWSPFIGRHAAAPAEFDARLGELLPHLGLLVSGGNTLLFVLEADRSVTVLARTRDDAAGEALDKGAKLLGLGYPGGPLIERGAAGGRTDAFEFPRGLDRRGEADFSFSGLKTSLRYTLEKWPEGTALPLADLCASYQQAVVDALVRKTARALEDSAVAFRSVGLSGGVANNRILREALAAAARRQRLPFLPARPEHTGDNAGMIAFAAWAAGPASGQEPPPDGMDLRIAPALELGTAQGRAG